MAWLTAVRGQGGKPSRRTAVSRGGPRRHRLMRLLACACALFIALAALAEQVEIPGLSYSIMLGTWGVDIFLALLLATALLTVLSCRRRSRTRLWCLTCLVLALGITGVTGGEQLAFTREQGVSLDAGALTGIGQSGSNPDAEPLIVDDPLTDQELRAGIWLPRDSSGRLIVPAAASLPALSRPSQGEDRPAVPRIQARSTGKGRGVVVLIHGGGWSNGNRRNPMTRGQAAWLAREGYLAIAVDYPLSTPSQPTWELAESRAFCALAWVRAHAAEYGGDGTRVALVGDSAGGNLALEVAYRMALGQAPALSHRCGGELPAIAAISTTYPIADPVAFYRNPDLIMGPFVRERAVNYTGGTPSQFPQRYEAIDPMRKLAQMSRAQVTALPPTLIMAGEDDHVVPVAGARRLAAALEEVGAPHEALFMPATDHVFDLNPGSVASQVWRAKTRLLFQEAGFLPAGR